MSNPVMNSYKVLLVDQEGELFMLKEWVSLLVILGVMICQQKALY